jgi:hypothetical protein
MAAKKGGAAGYMGGSRAKRRDNIMMIAKSTAFSTNLFAKC